MTIACSTVIRLLLTVKALMSNQWPPACSVNNSDELGDLEGGGGGGGTFLSPIKTCNRSMTV